MEKINDLWRRLIEQLKNPVVLVVIGFIVIGIWALWLDSQYTQLGIDPRFFPESILINLAPELAGIAVGVLSIDYLNSRRQEQELKRQLIRQLGSKHNEVADTAANELRANGRNSKEGENWLSDGSLLGARLWYADLAGAKLVGANLSEADLYRSKLIGANLSQANLAGANLSQADLSQTDRYRTNLTGANLVGANFDRANLKGAQLMNAKLEGARFHGANLEDANLSGANLKGVSFYTPTKSKVFRKGRPPLKDSLRNTALYGADLEGAIIDEKMLSAALLDKTTIMPSGKKYKPSDSE